MKYLLVLSLLSMTLISCSRLDYVIEQGAGQLMLQNKSRKNKVVLKDQRVPQEHKNKIQKIENYKKYFYEYFGEEEKSIYTRTTMLKNEAVTYLVIASSYKEIKAKDTCFPVMGCFPYLGFFDPESSERYVKELEDANYVTYQRPVYAYSTLGYFEDTILSSFFHYDDYELAELIFHELFHTIFFAKNEVDLNEALANYYGKELAHEYFKMDTFKIKEMDEIMNKKDQIYKRLVFHADALNLLYQKEVDLTKEKAQYMLDHFLETTFYPDIRKLCGELKVSDQVCFPLKMKWNNASFAAFMTYEKDIDFISQLKKSLKVDLKKLLSIIKEDHERYQKESHPDEETFSRFVRRVHQL